MATKYMREERDGETVRIGVLAVFDDITELRELREAELRLAKEVETQHAELRDAYRDLEETNRRLGTVSRRVAAAKLGAAVVMLALFAAVGLYVWGHRRRDRGGSLRPPPPVAEGAPTVVVVEPAPIASTVSMIGRLAPRREVEVTSPISGKVARVHVRPGEGVVEGQRLVEMDVTEARIDHREVQVAYIKALDRVEELEGWSDHADVSRARRVLTKTRLALEARKTRLSETAFLLERGLIPGVGARRRREGAP